MNVININDLMMNLSMRCYKLLIWLYPAEFRDEYGAEMIQVFRDCCLEANRESGGRGVLRVWLSETADLMMNAAAERMAGARRESIRRLMTEANIFSIGMLLVLATWVWMWWCIYAVAVFLWIPWDTGIPPVGTLAKLVNDSMEIYELGPQIGMIGVFFSVMVFFNRLVRHRQQRLARFPWRFAASNFLTGVMSLALMGGCMLISRLMFPNPNLFEGDQSYGVTLVYLGLILIPALVLSPLWLQARWFALRDKAKNETNAPVLDELFDQDEDELADEQYLDSDEAILKRKT